MSVLSGLPPRTLKDLFANNGYDLVGEDEYNWMLACDGDVPLIIPKLGHVAAPEVMDAAMEHARRKGLLRQLMGAVAEHVSRDYD